MVADRLRFSGLQNVHVESHHVASQRYVNSLTLLSAEQAYQNARINLVQAQASRIGDTAALFQALGGGLWNRREIAMADKPAQADPAEVKAR